MNRHRFLHEHFLEWTPDGSRIVFAHGTSIQSIDIEGSDPRLIVDVNLGGPLYYYLYADVSPIKSRLVYTTCRFYTKPPSWDLAEFVARPNIPYFGFPYPWFFYGTPNKSRRREGYHYEIATANIDGSGTKRLTENFLLDHYPVWSPDETRIAFISNPDDWLPREGNGRLYTMAADGSDVRLLTPSLGGVAPYPPVWSPDGHYIVFTVLEEDERGSYTFDVALYTVRSDGSDLTKVGEGLSLPFLSAPSWAPDSSELAFAKRGEEGAGVYAVRPDGSGLRLITPTPSEASLVSWSPDGAEILFRADTMSVVRPDGTGLRSLGGATFAAWSPDSSRIATLSFHPLDYGWRFGYYDGWGVIRTVSRDGTDWRPLVRWHPSEPGAGPGPGPLIAESPGSVSDIPPCRSGVAVPDPDSNTGLVDDCEILLTLVDDAPAAIFLNWGEHLPMDSWEGVTVGGSPKRVTELMLPNRRFPGTIPAEIGRLRALQHLQLTGQRRVSGFQGSIPPEIGDLAELRVLDLGGNSLSGTIPQELARLTNLEVLDLGGNRLTGVIPSELARLVNLKRLNLGGNRLSGGIPRELSELTELRTLVLSGNPLAGSIPIELGRLVNLQYMLLGYSQLTGTIPDLSPLESLITLELRGNDLSGHIPSHLGDLTNLQMLNLFRNNLEGSIPPELGNLANLRWVDLGSNSLTGSIPPELGNLKRLDYLNITMNSLEGVIPPALRRVNWLARDSDLSWPQSE